MLAPGTTISATIANEFTEAVGDLYTSSLIALGLILFVITFIVLAIARYLLLRIERRIGADRHERSSIPRRRRRNSIAMGLSFAATAFGLGWLVLILGVLLWEGLQRPFARGLHRDDAAARRGTAACSIRSSAA